MKAGSKVFWGVAVLLLVTGCASDKAVTTEVPSPSVVQTEATEVPKTVEPTPITPVTPVAPVSQIDLENLPHLTFEKSVHDYGSVGPSSSNPAEFPFTNTGKGVLKIERFHTPCGCTVPELAKKEYAPGESGIIRVRYTAPAGAATDVKPIYVYSNDPQKPQYELTIKAQVAVNVEITPQDVSLLLNQDNAGMPKLTVKSIDGKEFGITSVTSTNDAVKISFDPKKKASEIVLDPKVDMEKLKTTTTGVIQIRTDHPQSGLLMVRFNAKPMYEVSRPRIILQNILPGEETVRDVWIRSNYENKVEIESFASTEGYMTIESQKQEGNHLLIMVKFTAPTDAQASSRRYITDELKIKLTNGHEVSVRCSGWFKLK
jgi:hypothetical protein